MAELAIAGVIAAGGVLAVVAGSPLTLLVFRLVDRRDRVGADAGSGATDRQADTPGTAALPSVARADTSLRGGLWIGLLERAAVYATIVAGWPEGLAVILAVKGLGRYPELRARLDPTVAERFIIGTFTSVLTACACAGLALLARAQMR